MRNMVTVYLTQYPEKKRSPDSLLNLDVAGDLTDDMLRDSKSKIRFGGAFIERR